MGNILFERKRIINPFAPQRAKITVEVDLQTGASEIKTDIPVPHIPLADILIQAASGVLKQYGKLVGEKEKAGNNDRKKEGSNNGSAGN
jgi:hypothetical protein